MDRIALQILDPDRLRPLVSQAEELGMRFPVICGQFIRRFTAELEP